MLVFLMVLVSVPRVCAKCWAWGSGRLTLQRVLGLAQAQVSGLLERGERLVDAGDG